MSERPGREPFAKEINYTCNSFWGKVHVRKEGEIYILIISKDVFNWKDRLKDLKLSSEVVDAAGGLIWIRVSRIDKLKPDIDFLRSYVDSLKKK